MPMEHLYLSIHELVDFLLRRGDIDSRIFNNASMTEGTRIHLRYQKIQNGDYLSEVPLKQELEFEDFLITLEGRADGIILGGKIPVIDEIKSTVAPLEEFYESQGEWHLGQAICYAYLYAMEKEEDEMEIRLTYISQHDDSKLFKSFVFSFEILKEKVETYLHDYLSFYRKRLKLRERRDASIQTLEFPFSEFRVGQKKLSQYVYSVCKNGGTFFFEAPTGTGKTISTLFPAIKTFPEGKNEKIFYLSAKNQTKNVALDALKQMIKKGLFVKSVLLSSKENMCRSTAKMCNPDECPYARSYYTKLRPALEELLQGPEIENMETILDFASKKEMCPFELQLDYSLYCDVVICDYNYLFDPLVYLKRYFEESKTPYFALIDEAHNLAERSLDMYTAELKAGDFTLLYELFKIHRHVKFKRVLKKLIHAFETLKSEEDFTIFSPDVPTDFLDILQDYFKISQDILKNYEEFISDTFLTCFRAVNRFLKIHEYYGENYKIYFQNDTSCLYLRCLDASFFLKDTVKKLRGAIYFSATLTPLEYFISCLGGDKDSPTMKLPSPFPKNHLLLLVRGDISTLYRNRKYSYQKIVDSILALVKERVGNYLVFFPSYQYLEDVYAHFPKQDYEVISQKKEMDLLEKDFFLSKFQDNPDKTTIGFAVLGGSFSEGIDLTGNRLIGVVIVGVGLPALCFERNLMKEYYESQGVSGFDYAYTNPGMNKVMQAAGRVIRTSEDVGVVLLIDQRFLTYKYQDLFKVEWSHYIACYSDEEIKNYTKRFWENY